MEKIKNHFGVRIYKDVKEYKVSDRDYLIQLILDHKFLHFVNQSLKPEELIKFTEIFGEVWTNESGGILSNNGESTAAHPETHKITRVSNTNNGALGDYEVGWHADISHKPWQTKGGTMPLRCLYCDSISEDERSQTHWFDQTWAYDHIPIELKDKVENLFSVHKAPYSTGWDSNMFPFILRCPITGKKSLSLQSLFFKNFVGLDRYESIAIVKKLFDVALSKENVISHKWSVGDLIISNNYTTSHKRESLTSKNERTLWRTTFQIPEIVPIEIKPKEF
jgi:taurine dioxygenase